MSSPNWQELIANLNAKGLIFEHGLSDQEVAAVEGRYRIRFPEDLRSFLQVALPTGSDFPRWRAAIEPDPEADAKILNQLSWPAESICFDIEHNDFWYSEWGDKPADVRLAKELATTKLELVPRLIPIYSHRYLPAEPLVAGNPVFSCYQTDVIYYGIDLVSYFHKEFLTSGSIHVSIDVRRIRFWSDLVDLNDAPL